MAAAHGLGKPTVIISHGMNLTQTYHDVLPSTIRFEICELYKKRLEEASDSRVVVTGPLFLDDAPRYVREPPRNKKKRILFATTPFIEDNYMDKETYQSHMEKYLGDLKKLENVSIKIKLHPREKHVDMYESIIKSLGCRNMEIAKVVPDKGFLFELISESDLVISFYSTVILDTIVMDRPLLMIDLVSPRIIENTFNPILNDRSAITVIGPEEDISKPVEEILSDKKLRSKLKENRHRFMETYMHRIDGNAGKRAFKAMKEIIKDT